MLHGKEAFAKTLTAYSANTSPREPTCPCFPKNSSTRLHGNSIPDRERHSAGKLLPNCSSLKALSILPTTGQTSVRAPVQLSFPRRAIEKWKAKLRFPLSNSPCYWSAINQFKPDFVAFGVCTRPPVDPLRVQSSMGISCPPIT